MNIGEVAAAAAGDENLFAQAVGMLEDADAPSSLARFNGAHQAGGTSAKDQSIETIDHFKTIISNKRTRITNRRLHRMAGRFFPGAEHTALQTCKNISLFNQFLG
jgi:hypothetical protein